MLIPKIEDEPKEERPKIVEQRLNLETVEVIKSPVIDYDIFDEKIEINNDFVTKEKEEDYISKKEELTKISMVKEKKVMPQMYPVGLVSGTYIICHNELGMYIIDQHAAKERINFEYYKNEFANPKNDTISLLVPINLEYPSNECIIINKNIDVLKNLNIDISINGANSFLIKSIPTWIKTGYEEETIKNIIDVLLEEEITGIIYVILKLIS